MGKWTERLKKARDKIADFHDSVSAGAAKMQVDEKRMDNLMNVGPFEAKKRMQKATVNGTKLKKKVITEEYYE